VKAGEGNMNCAVRVKTQDRSLIVKQSRPWVEKYPQFEAPWDRALVEAEFYRWVEKRPVLRACMPRLLAADSQARLLVLEDLGESADLTGVYQGAPMLEEAVLGELAKYLSELHTAFMGRPVCDLLRNRQMRKLNSQHIFFIPLMKGCGPDLDTIQPGLQALAQPLQADDALRDEVQWLGNEAYLRDGPCLLHGDFFPGSILQSGAGPKVIDPEFCFFGRPEFDSGVLLAHLAMANQPEKRVAQFLERYQAPPGFDQGLMLQLAGVEIVRRLIGFAQLPLDCDLKGKADLLRRGRELVLRPDTAWLRS
jgi:5-methylthioribose kinase